MNEWSVVSLYRIEHLGLNVVLQLLVGVPLEMVHGATRIGLVYVAGVVAGRQVGPVSSGETSPKRLGMPVGSGKPQASRGPRTFVTKAPDYYGCPAVKSPYLPWEARKGTATQRGRHVMAERRRA